MIREIRLEQVAQKLDETLSEMEANQSPLIVVDKGKRKGALVPMEFFERWMAEREASFGYFDQLKTRAVRSSEAEVARDVEQAIREVRGASGR